MMIPIIMILSTAFCFYFDNHNWLNKNIDFVPFIHNVVVGLGSTCVVIYNFNIINDYETTTGFWYIIFPLLSSGYSFYDLYTGLVLGKTPLIIHGIITMIISVVSFYPTPLYAPLSNFGYVTELSSIFLNLRPLRKTSIDIMFAVMFFITRILFLPYVSYFSPSIELKILSFALTVLNVYWFVLIVKKMLKQIKAN